METTEPSQAPPGARPQLTAWHPPRRVLEVAELVLSGLTGGTTGGSTAADGALPVGLPAPPEVLQAAVRDGGVVLEDAEGIPVATLREPRVVAGGGLDGRLEAGRPFAHGPLREQRRPPQQVRAELLPGRTLAVAVDGSLDAGWPGRIGAAAERRQAGQVLVLALVGDGRRRDLPPAALLRAATAAAAELPLPALTVPVAVPRWPGDGAAGDRLVAAAASALGAGELLPDDGAAEGPRHAVSAAELAGALPPPHRRGVTVFFTGLSGSGKSTVAKGLVEAIGAAGDRSVSLLDGDEVRRLLSAGLGFSRADRDLNIRRVGFVATEVTRHGGIAVCAPIAPFAQVREEVRGWVEEVGDFVLVHVATPLAECERRDRKGLYERARQGLIPEFTGISSPYEVPEDADLRLDTTGISVAEAVERVRSLLERRGYLRPPAVGDRGART